MAEALALNLRDDPSIKSLLDLLNTPGHESEQKEFMSILDYFEALSGKYESVLTRLDAISEKLDKKNPLFERLSSVVSGIGEKLKALKDSIIDFAKNTLESAKNMGLSAVGAVSEKLHISEGLEAVSKGLGKAAAGCETLEHFHQERAAMREAADETPSVSLAELLSDTRVDFENLSQDELTALYEKLLAIGMDNDLSAHENTCLQFLTEEVESLLPDRGESEHTQEHESEMDIGEEI